MTQCEIFYIFFCHIFYLLQQTIYYALIFAAPPILVLYFWIGNPFYKDFWIAIFFVVFFLIFLFFTGVMVGKYSTDPVFRKKRSIRREEKLFRKKMKKKYFKKLKREINLSNERKKRIRLLKKMQQNLNKHHTENCCCCCSCNSETFTIFCFLKFIFYTIPYNVLKFIFDIIIEIFFCIPNAFSFLWTSILCLNPILTPELEFLEYEQIEIIFTDQNFEEIFPLLMIQEIFLILHCYKKLPSSEVFQKVKKRLLNKYEDLDCTHIQKMELIFENILTNNVDNFSICFEQKNNVYIQFMKIKEFITIFFKSNISTKPHSLPVDPSAKARFLLHEMRTVYHNDLWDLKTKTGKSLSIYGDCSLDDLGIHNGSELDVITGTLPGGSNERERDYGRKKSKRIAENEKIKQEKSSSKYPQYPFKFQENYDHLTRVELICFQCCIFWEFCIENKLEISLDSTMDKFFRNTLPSHFFPKDLKILFERFISKQISSETFKSPYRTPQNIENFVNNLTLEFYRQNTNDDLNFLQFIQDFLSQVNVKNPGLLKDLNVSIDLLKFAIGSLESFVKIFQIIENDISFDRERDKNDLIHKTLIFILFSNRFDIPNSKLHEIFKVSTHLIQSARVHIEEFKNGKLENFDKSYAIRKKFSFRVDEYIRDFFDTEPIPCFGNKTCSTYISKKEGSVKENLLYIDCTCQEFYERFVKKYGQYCTLADMKTQCTPGFTYFWNFKPKNVVTFTHHETGHCQNCLQMIEFLKTFKRILNKYCNCSESSCVNFIPDEENPLGKDSCCACEKCSSCKKKLLSPIRLKSFMQAISCEGCVLGGRMYPDWVCLENKCSKCKLKNKFDVIKKFCPDALEKIKLNLNQMVKTKMYKKVNIETKSEKKTGSYEAEKLLDVDFTIDDFLAILFQKLVGHGKYENKNEGKNGFIWHYHVKNFQRQQYNKVVKNAKNGTYGKNFSLFIIDWAEAYTVLDSYKLVGNQFFKNSKCQILGLVEYTFGENGFKGVSNFYLSDQNVNAKNTKNVLSDLKERIEEQKKANPNINKILIFSDGSGNEFQTYKNTSNMIDFAKDLGVSIIWNFLGARHGKNICDTEFGKVKTN